eukprot:TRINITY_DN62_c0_g1_i5.p1 TRINITY_DN62_c0_g1~~TRINITY_DN62_c0_g1_i5.p1  ORF type:complete len:351 (-),score=182.44 TRINITY_DN62_c0_g1_i5:687-1739(-)
MSDEEYYEEEEVTSTTSKKGDGNFLKARQEAKKGELDEQLKEYINEWRKQRSKEEEELKRLKEKQAKRKEIRAEQEKKLAQQKKEEEERLRKEEADKKAKEAEEKRKRLEEAEKKRQAMMQAQKEKQQASGQGVGKGIAKKSDGGGLGNVQDARREMTKTKEQLEEEKKISLSIRIKPLDLDGMDSDMIRSKASELWDTIVRLETEKYDLEERQKRQDYDLKELKERQKQQLRQKAMKKGLDPEALTGKYPPKIRMYSKYERRTDTRTYEDRRKLYEGGWEVVRAEHLQQLWKEKYDEWQKRPKSKLPKWFGERPGKKPGDPESPEDDEEGAADAPAIEDEEEEEEEEEE